MVTFLTWIVQRNHAIQFFTLNYLQTQCVHHVIYYNLVRPTSAAKSAKLFTLCEQDPRLPCSCLKQTQFPYYGNIHDHIDKYSPRNCIYITGIRKISWLAYLRADTRVLLRFIVNEANIIPKNYNIKLQKLISKML